MANATLIESAPVAQTRTERRATERAEQRPSRKRKAVIAGVVAGALAGTAGIGAALTDQKRDEGHYIGQAAVGISLYGQTIYIEDALPGDTIEHTLTVQSHGTTGAYLALSVDDPTMAADILSVATWDVNVDGTEEVTGVRLDSGQQLNLTAPLPAGQDVDVDITIHIPDMDNDQWSELQSAGFDLVVDAVQAAHTTWTPGLVS